MLRTQGDANPAPDTRTAELTTRRVPVVVGGQALLAAELLLHLADLDMYRRKRASRGGGAGSES